MGLIDYIFPPTCHICGATIRKGEHICGLCRGSLPRTLYHRNPDNPMALRFAGQFPFRRTTGYFFYNPHSSLANLIQDLKYRHFPSIGKFLGSLIGEELFPTGFFEDIDGICPVPIYFFKKAQRGYNQTEMIAQGLNLTTGIPVAPLLKATRPHRTQTSLTHEQRRRNLQKVFRAKQISPRFKHILLIDDICTTGATLTEAAITLLNAQPSLTISMLSVGVTEGG